VLEDRGRELRRANGGRVGEPHHYPESFMGLLGDEGDIRGVSRCGKFANIVMMTKASMYDTFIARIRGLPREAGRGTAGPPAGEVAQLSKKDGKLLSKVKVLKFYIIYS